MTYGSDHDDRLTAIASALAMPLDEIRQVGSGHAIVSGHCYLKHDQSLALVKAFHRIDNPKTRAMLVNLVETVAALEHPADLGVPACRGSANTL